MENFGVLNFAHSSKIIKVFVKIKHYCSYLSKSLVNIWKHHKKEYVKLKFYVLFFSEIEMTEFIEV